MRVFSLSLSVCQLVASLRFRAKSIKNFSKCWSVKVARRQLSKSFFGFWENGIEIYLRDGNTSLKLNALLCLTIAFIIHSKQKRKHWNQLSLSLTHKQTLSLRVSLRMRFTGASWLAATIECVTWGRCCDIDTTYHLDPITTNWDAEAEALSMESTLKMSFARACILHKSIQFSKC